MVMRRSYVRELLDRRPVLNDLFWPETVPKKDILAPSRFPLGDRFMANSRMGVSDYCFKSSERTLGQ